MRKLIPVLIGLLLIGGGCSPAKKSMDTAVIRQEVEAAYAQLTTAIEQDDMEAFLKVSPPPDDRKLTKEDWTKALPILKKEFKPLSADTFVETYYQDPRAYYFHNTYLDDPNFDTIDVLVFEKKNGGWILTSGGSSYSGPKKENKNNEAISKWIRDFKAKLSWKEFKPKHFTLLSMSLPADFTIEESPTELVLRKDAANYIKIIKRKSFEERMAEQDLDTTYDDSTLPDEEATEEPEKIEPVKTISTHGYDIELYYSETGKEAVEIVADTIRESIPPYNE